MPKKDPPRAGRLDRKVQPRLRMVTNGDRYVNALRAEHSSSIAVADPALLAEVEPRRGADPRPVVRSALPRNGRMPHLKAVPGEILASVFVDLTADADLSASFPGATSRRGTLLSATLPLDRIAAIARDARVAFVEMGEPLAAPTPVVSPARVAAPSLGSRRFGSTRRHRGGEGVLVGIIDVQGFDFAHPDFVDGDGKTRFVRIWDQGGDARPSPGAANPRSFDYGAEFRHEHLQAALDAERAGGLDATELERQSQRVPGSHATHVASIAAGNRGVCPRAHLAGVLVSLPAADHDRRLSFYDSARIAHAVEYLFDLAYELGNLPVSINISLGTNGHAHDASSAVSRWIDSALSVPGRCVTVAAGNAGQEMPAFEGDIGYVMGRIHTSGRIEAAGLVADVDWLVPGNGIVDISENELELWYGPQDRLAISIRPPGMGWIGPIEPGHYLENHQLEDGSFLSAYNELYHPANGNNYIAVYLSPLMSPRGIVGVRAGRWRVRLHGVEIRDGRYHAWIERDDPRRLGRLGPREAWSFPSFFGESSYVDRSTVNSLGCGHRIVAVANLDRAGGRIHVTSSQGPTRDDRLKPEVAADGTDVVAARGFARDEGLWIAMTGTSMASPFVAGLAGLMLATEPSLTAAQIGGILQRTARPLPGRGYAWLDDAGFGVVDAEACLEEAARVNRRRELTP